MLFLKIFTYRRMIKSMEIFSMTISGGSRGGAWGTWNHPSPCGKKYLRPGPHPYLRPELSEDISNPHLINRSGYTDPPASDDHNKGDHARR